MPGEHWVTGSNPPTSISSYITVHCQQVWSSIMNCSCSRKTLGFPTEDSIGKLLLRRMASDHWWVSWLFCHLSAH